jgi:hypothetical protein
MERNRWRSRFVGGYPRFSLARGSNKTPVGLGLDVCACVFVYLFAPGRYSRPFRGPTLLLLVIMQSSSVDRRCAMREKEMAGW